MTKSEFQKLKLDGIFLFYSNLCKQCEAVKTELIRRVPNVNYVLCDEDPDFYWKIHNVDMIPCVRFYENGVMTYEKIYKLELADYDKLLELSAK